MLVDERNLLSQSGADHVGYEVQAVDVIVELSNLSSNLVSDWSDHIYAAVGDIGKCKLNVREWLKEEAVSFGIIVSRLKFSSVAFKELAISSEVLEEIHDKLGLCILGCVSLESDVSQDDLVVCTSGSAGTLKTSLKPL